MMYKFKLRSLIVPLIAIAIALAGCSTIDSVRYKYDAVRIKPEYQNRYDTLRIDGEVVRRNGSALKGTVMRLETRQSPEDTSEMNTYVVFLDSMATARFEKIPIEHVDLIGEKAGLGRNYFEHFNDPLNPRAIREVPHDTIVVPHGETPETMDCGCDPLYVGIGLQCPFIDCRVEALSENSFFAELKGGYAIYNDVMPAGLGNVARDAYFAELVMGYRFNYHWALGLALSTGVPLYNSLEDITQIEFNSDGEPISIYRPTALLHLKYSFEDTWCMIPFVYGQFGIAIDELSFDLFKITTYCDDSDCSRAYDYEPPGADISIPLSYGLGLGVDIPVSCWFDLSFDLGVRSIAFGEQDPFTLFGALVPQKRRVNMVVFRLGLSY
ncbi:MAG: hypothetical protein ACLFQX_06150 [Candidatus Kapaibacterium sp.]